MGQSKKSCGVNELLVMLSIAEAGACNDFVRITTVDMAKGINVSQQTASRHLRLLETFGLIERKHGRIYSKSLVKITATCATFLTRLGFDILAATGGGMV